MGRLHAHVRPHVRAHVRSPLSGRAGGLSVHDGISFTASNGRVVIKAPGAAPTVTTLTSAFTFTGGNQSMYRGPSGLLIASATNTPRIEYGPGGDVYGLLMEASRTNKGLNSDDFTGANWAGGAGLTVSANAVAAPDGTVTADKLVEDGTTGEHRRRQTIATTAGATVTVSVFAKAAENPRINLRALDGAVPADVGQATYDLTTGTVVGGAAGGAGTGFATSITPYANGFYRCTMTIKPNATMVSCIVDIFEVQGSTTTTNYTGNSVNGNYVWGFQFEEAAFASSYIPTTTVSVARTADSCIRTLSTEFSATAGTVVVAGRASGGQDAAGNQNVYSLDDTTAANRIQLTRVQSTDTARYIVSTVSVAQATLDATFVNSTAYKHAAAWTANDYASSFNGAAVLTDPAGTIPTVTVLGLGVLGAGGSVANGHIRTFDYYPVRQPNEFLTSRST